MTPTGEVIAVLAVIGVAQFPGGWAYIAVKRKGLGELAAAIISGLVTTAVLAPAFVVLDVHHWMLGPETHWGLSVFLALCCGIVYGALYRGRPFERRTSGSDARGA